ncbi:MAG: class I SAM-dependent methyltransferase, partial [Patescibacteria group bacterium]
CYCPSCTLWQLDYIGDPNVIFPPEYPYQTGLTNMLVRNFRALADTVATRYHLTSSDLVIDIGSNDGTLLKGFKDKGTRVLGIEPTNVAEIANSRGIETIHAFFTPSEAKKILASHGPAKIITATNVFAHILNVPELMESIRILLADDGVFISESQYLGDIVEKLELDTIYHEHLRFYSATSLKKLFETSGCTMVDAERITAAGGSIRAYAMKGNQNTGESVRALLAAEERVGLNTEAVRKQFEQRALVARRNLLSLLLDLKKQGKRIVGLGSAGRSHSLLNFMKIDHTIIDYNCEKSGSPKIGLFTPGTHIPIVDEKKLFDEQPEYLLVLSWHIGDELMKKVRELGYRGTFIVPLPEPRMVKEV